MAQKRDQRRLAAVLVADVVGYSRLMETDETATLNALRERRKTILEPIVKEHGGRVVKVMGDGVLVEFASAVNSVKAAIELQGRFVDANENLPENRRILLRVGINLGDVIDDGGDIYGDGVNIAARLETLAEPGGICVSAKIHAETSGKVAAAFEDLGEQQFKNIARPVSCFRLVAGAEGNETSSRAAPGRGRRPPLSIVVLPFANLSSDPEQGYFADGLTEDITTDLSRIADSFVIARSTAFAYKDKATDLKSVARELGVHYVLEGSVQRMGNRVRVGARLIDGRSGAHLWADRFEHDIAELAAFQDEVTQRIAQALSLELVDAESRHSRSSRPHSPDAVDLAMQGWSFLNLPAGKGNNIEARRLFERSLTIDEQLTSSLVGLASSYVSDFGLGWSSNSQADLDHAAGLIDRALLIDPKMAIAHRVRSWIFIASGRIPEAVTAAETAVALNRNDSMAYSLLALALLHLGEAEQSRLAGEKAIKLSPRDPNLWAPLSVVARAQLLFGENDAALANLRKAALANPAASFIRLNLAGAYGRMGRDREAREAVGEFLRLVPDLMEGRTDREITVIKAQIELAARGYYFGTADGLTGDMLERALAEFQQAQGLAETLELDAATLGGLGVTV